VRWATIAVLAVLGCIGCNDVRDFTGQWQGRRVGEAPGLRVGPGDAVTLHIDGIDAHGIRARIAVDNLFAETRITSLPGAEADALVSMTFSGDPIRVFLSFADVNDGNGDALVMIALYAGDRIDVRVMRGGIAPVYAIFALEPSP
jgi:hypothetical protein